MLEGGSSPRNNGFSSMGHPWERGGIPSKSPERGILRRITEKMFWAKLPEFSGVSCVSELVYILHCYLLLVNIITLIYVRYYKKLHNNRNCK